MAMSLTFIIALAASSQVSGATVTQATKAQSQREFMLKNYPPEALKRGEQGKVGFELTIESDGRPSECLVTESSGFVALDDGTCEFMVRYAHMNPVRAADGTKVRATKAGYINWKLPPNVTAIAAQADAGPALRERLVCKQSPVVGSIIKKVRRCMSPTQWEQHYAQTRSQLDQSIGIARCNEHGC